MRHAIISREDADKILQKDLTNIVKKASEGRPLTPYERARVKEASGNLAPDWANIKKDYVRHGMSSSRVAEKYGIPEPTVRQRAAREKWNPERKQFVAKVLQGAEVEAVAEVKEWLKNELKDAIKMREKVNDSWDTLSPADYDAMDTVSKVRLRVNELGNRALNIGSTSLEGSNGTTNILHFQQQVLNTIYAIDAMKPEDKAKVLDVSDITDEEIERLASQKILKGQ